MARTSTKIPAEQLERLRARFAEERRALVELAAADKRVDTARAKVAAAEQVVREAQAERDATYQRLVRMVGSANAKALTSATSPSRRNSRGRSEVVSDGPGSHDRPVAA